MCCLWCGVAQPQRLEARQDFLDEVVDVVEVVDEVEGEAVEAYGVQAGELGGDVDLECEVWWSWGDSNSLASGCQSA